MQASTDNVAASDERLFLGLDLSTQALKGLLLDEGLEVVYERAVAFDRELPEFGTGGGVLRHSDGLTVTAPALMWVAALDRLLEGMKADGCALERIAAVSGSGQQHGSVWLKREARGALRGLDGARSLREQLAGCFSVSEAPVWMDFSTGEQCRALEQALGGAQAVAELTGSRAYERFTGNQIARIHQTRPSDYAATDRILLVSSFMASLLLGDYASIDWSDGSGMNLLDIRSKRWSERALTHTAPDLERRLGPPAPSHTVLGTCHAWLRERFGFRRDCAIVAFSGDNPCSLAGLRLQRPGDVAVSLGTSDTVFGSLRRPAPSGAGGHIFINPVDPDAYMAMICFKNGSLVREWVRDEVAGGSWSAFEAMAKETPAGNMGRIGFYFREPEITPPILRTGCFRFDGEGRPVERFPAAAEARAILEGQFLAMRVHGERIGLQPSNILATGGASVNAALLRTMADVFGVPVFVGEQPNSAALGAAYRARHGWMCHLRGSFVPFAEAVAGAPAFRKAAEPDAGAHGVYTEMMGKYEELALRVAKH
jgi:xylulokinase